jgi:hypothetical protein
MKFLCCPLSGTVTPVRVSPHRAPIHQLQQKAALSLPFSFTIDNEDEASQKLFKDQQHLLIPDFVCFHPFE